VNYIEREVDYVEIAEEYDDHYVFSVKDNGVGTEHYEKIFKTFQSYILKVSIHRTWRQAINKKKIAKAYNGKIWIESELGGQPFFVKRKNNYENYSGFKEVEIKLELFPK
jgi:light-regulated signal transduction histidine kinase (bacteriophytochrome)